MHSDGRGPTKKAKKDTAGPSPTSEARKAERAQAQAGGTGSSYPTACFGPSWGGGAKAD